MPSRYSRMARVVSARSATYRSSRRIQDLRIAQDLIADNPVQAFLRDEINGAAEELLQIFLQSEIGHSEIISRHAHVEKVNIPAWLRVSARNRPEDGQLRNAVLPAQLSELRPHRPDLVQGHASYSLRPPAYQSTAHLAAG